MKLSKKIYIGLLLVLIIIITLTVIHLKQKSTIDDETITGIDIREQTWNLSFWNQTNIWFNNFDTDILEFILGIKKNENFMISPISFKAALAMLTIWASWDTQKKLLDIIWYYTSDSYLNWAIKLKTIAEENNERINEFNKQQEKYNNWDFLWNDNTKEDTNKQNSFMIANSIRHNSDQEWKFTEEYIQNIAKIWWIFWEIPGAQLHTKINERVNKYTNWLIPISFFQLLDRLCLCAVTRADF